MLKRLIVKGLLMWREIHVFASLGIVSGLMFSAGRKFVMERK
tara:strand:+ start:630 stop:755 length:126 start_codon:yes stop_codon:yes gene_type:complete